MRKIFVLFTTAAMAISGGNSDSPINPDMAGQKEQYLVESLKAYKSGARDNAMMKPMVASLSDADIENLAAYFSGQACK